MDLIDLAMCHFKHCGDLWCLQKLGELVGSHSQVGAWNLVDVVAINAEILIIEVALEWPSL